MWGIKIGRPPPKDKVTALLGEEFEDDQTATTAESTAMGDESDFDDEEEEHDNPDDANQPREPPAELLFGGRGEPAQGATGTHRRKRRRNRTET